MVLALASILLSHSPLTAQESSKKDRGYVAAKFDTRYGDVNIYLPNDISPGDTITGTVFVDNLSDGLKDLQVDIGDVRGVKTDPKSTYLKWVIPNDARDGYPLIVRAKDGRQLGATRLPINPSPGNLDAYTFPNFVQVGRPAVIWGPFNGDASKTKVAFKDSSVSILAESPHSMVLYVPYDTPVGATPVTLKKNGKTAKAEIRAISIDLSTPKISLDKDEKATVTIKVEGLTGLNETTVPYIQVQNMTPDIFDLEGQAIHVLIPKVSKDGKYRRDFKGVCKRSGSFLVTTFVEPGPGIPVVPN